jgi:hypothetical protein
VARTIFPGERGFPEGLKIFVLLTFFWFSIVPPKAPAGTASMDVHASRVMCRFRPENAC